MNDLSSKKIPELKLHNSWNPWVIASLIAILVLGVALVLMYFLGLFSTVPDANGSKTIAAALALVGSLFAAVVTLIGIVIKYSIDQRNYALAVVAEQRNRTETVIRAVDLLGENNKDSTPHKIGGAIMALVNLGELDLAIALLSELWPAGLASPNIAVEVLSRAFKSSSEATIIGASTTLFNNAKKIDLGDSHIWPIMPLGWNKDFPDNAKLAIVQAAVTWMIEGIANPDHFPEAFVVLYAALEDDDFMVRGIAAALEPLTEKYPESTWLGTIDGPLSMLHVTIRLSSTAIGSSTNASEDTERRVREALGLEPPKTKP